MDSRRCRQERKRKAVKQIKSHRNELVGSFGAPRNGLTEENADSKCTDKPDGNEMDEESEHERAVDAEESFSCSFCI